MGLLHIYCGDGKGKTTAAAGLAVRAAGAGMKVCFVQLMKGGYTSELAPLGSIEGIEIMRCDREYGFFKNMTDEDKISISRCHNELLERAFSGNFDMIILDEFNSAYSYGLLDKITAEKLVFGGRENAEIILTGRGPGEPFLNKADYISQIKCLKHPYEKGIPARKGIEF
ncbi:MAG: cob(I)yrinic acid a,c-diamide adenosyltransferase [Ruminococcus sp.]|nr:cob(I)yrinic acid a,c-diamide adenosyltransferase [Ruminococcus sp.]